MGNIGRSTGCNRDSKTLEGISIIPWPATFLFTSKREDKTMDAKEALVKLRNLYQSKDWFADVGTDQYGRYVIYIKYMCPETISGVIDYHEGVQIVVHFDMSKTATREQFT